MSPSPTPSVGAAAAPLPPLPDMNTGGAADSQPQGGGDIMASLMSGIGPIKSSVDGITAACKQIVQSGVIPGAEQVCGQIIALATSLLPMAAQNLLNPQGGAQGGSGMGQMGPMLPPPGGPAPLPQ